MVSPVMFAATALGAFLLSFVGVYGLRFWARVRGVVDIPNGRSSHVRPTPRGGGLAVALASGLVFMVFLEVARWHAELSAWIAALGLLLALIGAIDDIVRLPALVRLAGHAAVTAVLLAFGGFWRVVELPLAGRVELGWLGVAIAFLWVVGMTNAYNFMDGIDGIAGLQAIVAGVGWALLAGVRSPDGLLGLIVAAASAGFLVHNWPPARIFMGDVGSTFLGWIFACLAIRGAVADPRLGLAGLLLVWPFVFDASLTLLRRARRNENLLQAHRSHLYQRLVICGWSHRTVTLIYGGLAAAGVGAAFLWLHATAVVAALGLVSLGLLACGLWVLVVKVEAARLP